jgi:hypothetical protein
MNYETSCDSENELMGKSTRSTSFYDSSSTNVSPLFGSMTSSLPNEIGEIYLGEPALTGRETSTIYAIIDSSENESEEQKGS